MKDYQRWGAVPGMTGSCTRHAQHERPEPNCGAVT